MLRNIKYKLKEVQKVTSVAINKTDSKKRIAVNVMSFGFKYGVPTDADLVFDVRFLPNPFYIPELKEKTGLEIETFLVGHSGGMEQIASKISFNEIDTVFYFRSTDPAKEIGEAESTLLRLCDVYNIPLATNIATAEAVVNALDNGSLNWREFINPRSDYNMKKRGIV